MMLRHLAFLGALSVAVVAVVACGGSDSGSTSQAVTTNFDGVYVPSSAGAIGSIAFSHGRDYLLMPTGCKAQSCTEIGTYRIDTAKNVVVLTNAAKDETRSLSLKVLSTQRQQATIAKAQSLGVRDLIEKEGGDSEQITGGGDAGNLIALIQQLINMITQAALGGQDMSQLGGDDAGSDDDSVDPSTYDAGASYSCTDGGATAGVCTFTNCTTNWPTAASTASEISYYFARCPYGPTTYAH